jgi:hypothetical protein
MNVEIGTEAALFPEKEYISGIFLAVYIYVPETQRRMLYLESDGPGPGTHQLELLQPHQGFARQSASHEVRPKIQFCDCFFFHK